MLEVNYNYDNDSSLHDQLQMKRSIYSHLAITVLVAVKHDHNVCMSVVLTY